MKRENTTAKLIHIPNDDLKKLGKQAIDKEQKVKHYIESQLTKLANRKQKATT